jgi:lipoprotein-anchoring transpeptidase ErfK/SrfK
MQTANNKLSRTSKFILAALVLLSIGARAQEAISRQIVVSIPDRKLAIVENGAVVKVYSVAVGAEDSPSPTGSFVIVNRLTDPTYYHKGTVIGPGSANPLGNRWIGLNQKGYGIHGTNVQSSIGKAASHGCIRVGRKDLADLFSRVQVGDVVEIHGDRDELVAKTFGTSTTVITASAAAPASVTGQ